MLTRPRVFAYHDYRLFLKDWFSFLKASDRGFSIRKISASAKISPALLSLVLSGQRDLTGPTILRLAAKINLKPAEQKYLKLLVKMSESKDQAVRQQAYEQIKRFNQYQESNPKEIEVHRYMSNWFYVAIRELAAHPDFKGDIKWIQKRLIKHVPAQQIKEAIAFLEEHKFISPRRGGGYDLPTKNLDCLGGVFQLSLNQFHRQILKIASDSIDNVPKDRRSLTGYTFLMSQESYLKLIDVWKKTEEKIRSIESEDQNKPGKKAVYHVEFLALPLTRGEK